MKKKLYLMLIPVVQFFLLNAHSEKLLTNATQCKQMFFTPSILATIKNSPPYHCRSSSPIFHTTDRPLLRAYPNLKDRLPWISLADVPTPILHLTHLGADFKSPHLYMKHDGKTSTPVGGNKMRKLELLFADALNQGARHIITFGCAGSNHATTTAFHAQKLGFSCSLFLEDQPNSAVVRNNLLINAGTGAQIFFYPSEELRKLGALNEFVQRSQEDGIFPYVIPIGGSSPLGAIGYINAVFELKEQIKQGIIPEPDYIYCATGSLGTLSGLLIGLRACDLKTKLVPIAVEPDEYMVPLLKLATLTNDLLRSLDSGFPLFSYTSDNVLFNMHFVGPDYGVLIPEAQAAMTIFKEKEGIALEGTYTGKAAAALLEDIAAHPELREKVILFWNTFGIEEQAANHQSYTALPKPLHHYFKKETA